MSEVLEPKNEVMVDPWQSELEKYQREISAVQKQLDDLDAKKTEMLRIGYRLEGVVAYIKTKMAGGPADHARTV